MDKLSKDVQALGIGIAKMEAWLTGPGTHISI
jgi:hypothetical protein